MIRVMCEQLRKIGMQLVLFVEEGEAIQEAFKDYEIIFINTSSYTKKDVIRHIRDFHRAIESTNIEAIIYHAGSSPALLWDLILFRYHNVLPIVQLHECFSHIFTNPKYSYGYKARDLVFSCVEKVLCLSTYAEKYLRSQNVNSFYIHNPIFRSDNLLDISKRKNNIIFMGRLDDKVKQVSHSILILEELIKRGTEATILFIGDFKSHEARDEFIKFVKNKKLLSHVKFMGWQDNPERYLDECKVMLCTSYSEGFPLAISEAQGRGLPCIIYTLPIMIAKDNESIITVAQGDFSSAANEITRLLNDTNELIRLSKIAYENSLKFSLEEYNKRLLEILYASDIFNHEKRRNNDYETVIDSIIFHAKMGLSAN